MIRSHWWMNVHKVIMYCLYTQTTKERIVIKCPNLWKGANDVALGWLRSRVNVTQGAYVLLTSRRRSQGLWLVRSLKPDAEGSRLRRRVCVVVALRHSHSYLNSLTDFSGFPKQVFQTSFLIWLFPFQYSSLPNNTPFIIHCTFTFTGDLADAFIQSVWTNDD